MAYGPSGFIPPISAGSGRKPGRHWTQGEGDKGYGRQSWGWRRSGSSAAAGRRAARRDRARRAARDRAATRPRATGLTGPQRAFPVWDGVPGYEFEGRAGLQTPAGRPPGNRAASRSRAGRPRRRGAPVQVHPDGEPADARPAVGLGRPAAPGFEFGAAAPTAGPFEPGAPGPEPAAAPGPAHARPRHAPAAARPSPRDARAEWARLLRSFLPEPVKRNWFAEFRSALHFRGAGVRVIIPILAMMVFGVAVAVIAGANSSHDGPAPPPAALGFPPATLAGNAFSAAASGRGISQTLGRVTSDGAEIVAVGSQQGARIARAQFFVSTDDGRTWSMGHVRTPDGGPPPPGYAARFVAGGPGAWVALGPSSIWTSPDGRTWTLASTAGLPLRPGDQISVVKRTAAGFIAAGVRRREHPGGLPVGQRDHLAAARSPS